MRESPPLASFPDFQANPTEQADYKFVEQVERAFRESRLFNETTTIRNKGPSHAKIVTDLLLDSASSSVKIICGVFSHTIFSTDKFYELLNNDNSSIEIIMDSWHIDHSNSGAYDLLTMAKNAKARRKLHFFTLNSPAEYHVGIFDEMDIRREINKVTREAIVAFNGKEETKKQIAYFEKVLRFASELSDDDIEMK